MSRFNKPISSKKDKSGLMQVEIFPQRVLRVETAQRLLDELNEIPGIRRMVVFGPRIPFENPDDLLNGRFGAAEKKHLNIKGEQIELTVQVGRIWIEIESPKIVDPIRKAAENALPFPFEMYEGLYIRSQQTVVDHAKGMKADDVKLGLFDPKDKRGRPSSCCGAPTDIPNDQG
ncbi:MAG TPA: methyl-coenzyme M reductase operon protein D [Methanocella sp.]|nr:methyl-coenzyme M reductase operon protein D [Methanocella sp.]